MALNNKRILPDEYVVKQGDKGNTAFLIISGALNVEIDGKKVGKMESGEIFGELSLILGEERKASIGVGTKGFARTNESAFYIQCFEFYQIIYHFTRYRKCSRLSQQIC